MTIENGIPIYPNARSPLLHDLRFSPDALWQLGESGGAVDFSDSSGNGETLQVESGAVKPGPGLGGACACILGGGDALSLATDNGNLGYTGDMTLLCWFRPLDTTTGCIACYDANGSAEADSAPWMFFYNPASSYGTFVLQYQFWNGSSLTTRQLISEVGLLHTEWNHIVIARRYPGGGDVNTYTQAWINGKQAWASEQAATTQPTAGASSKLVIGSLAGGSTSCVAAIQSLQLVGSRLTDAQIEAEIARVCPNNLLGDN